MNLFCALWHVDFDENCNDSERHYSAFNTAVNFCKWSQRVQNERFGPRSCSSRRYQCRVYALGRLEQLKGSHSKGRNVRWLKSLLTVWSLYVRTLTFRWRSNCCETWTLVTSRSRCRCGRGSSRGAGASLGARGHRCSGTCLRPLPPLPPAPRRHSPRRSCA